MQKQLNLLLVWPLSLLFCFGALNSVQANESCQQQAATVKLVIGQAYAQNTQGQLRLLDNGDVIQEGETLETEAGARLFLRFCDQGSLSLRPKTVLKIQKYRYLPEQPENNKVEFDLLQGSVRSITGKAGQANKENYRLNTPVVAIGIRGTDYLVQTDQKQSFAALYSGAIVMASKSQCDNPLSCQTAIELNESLKDHIIKYTLGMATPELTKVTEQAKDSVDVMVHEVEVLQEEADEGSPEEQAQPTSESHNSEEAQQTSTSSSSDSKEPLTLDSKRKATDVLDQLYTQAVNLSGALTPQKPALTLGVLPASINKERPEGWYPVMANNVATLYQTPETMSYTPTQGQFNLLLANTQVKMLANPDIPVSVSKGILALDLTNSRFATQFTMNANGYLDQAQFTSQGAISNRGKLVSDSGQGFVTGLITSKGQEAAYLFSTTTQGQYIQGATQWQP